MNVLLKDRASSFYVFLNMYEKKLPTKLQIHILREFIFKKFTLEELIELKMNRLVKSHMTMSYDSPHSNKYQKMKAHISWALSAENVHILQWLLSYFAAANELNNAKIGLQLWHDLHVFAIRGRHNDLLNLVQCLMLSQTDFSTDQDDQLAAFGEQWMALAAEKGNLDAIKAMHKMKSYTGVMDRAAICGHLDIVKWLHFNRQEGCSKYAMDYAVHNQHYDVFMWLHENREEGCTTLAMDFAASDGNLEVVQFLHEHRTEGCTTNAMDYAAQKGHFEIVKWLHENRTEGCTTNAMDYAAANGHLQVVQWLHAHRLEGCSYKAIDLAARDGHLNVVKWLHENTSCGCTVDAMNNAAGNGHLETLIWLHENRTEGCTEYAMEYAAGNGHLDVVKWLCNNRTEGCIVSSIQNALENNHLEIVKFLQDYMS